MGMVQNTGNVKAGMIPAEAPALLAPYVKLASEFVLEFFAQYTTGWWLQTEDLPDPNNRVRCSADGKLYLEYTANNLEARDRLIHRWTSVLRTMDESVKHVMPFNIYPHPNLQNIPTG